LNEDSSNPAAPGQEAHPPPSTRRAGALILPVALFFMGVLVGALAFMLYGILSEDPLLVRRLGPQGADVAQIREAARAGTLDAIATLQAGGGVQPASPTPAATPTQLPKTAFTLREANRLGKPDAPVTIVEYSDFQ
jgi:hypothetical protein